MSKAPAITAPAVGSTAIVTGGYYLVKSGDTSEEKGKSQLEFENVEAFKANLEKSTCINLYFKGLKANASAPTIEANKPDSSSFFKSGSGDNVSSNGCLFVEYKKENYDDNKWSGKISWLWTFSTGDEGFINFNMAETVDGGKLKFTGIFYLVSKKNGEENVWEIKHQSPATLSTEIEFSTIDDYFPKPSSNLTAADKSYWGFFTNKNDDLKKICSSTSCTTNSGNPSIDYKEFVWIKKESSDKSLTDWTEKLDWWSKLYSNVNTHWNLVDKIANFKGEWKEENSSSN